MTKRRKVTYETKYGRITFLIKKGEIKKMKFQPTRTFARRRLTRHPLFPEIKGHVIDMLKGNGWVSSRLILSEINESFDLKMNRRQIGWVIRALRFRYDIKSRHTSNPYGIVGWHHMKKFSNPIEPHPPTLTYYLLMGRRK